MGSHKKIAIVIPAKNEEKTIANVLRKISQKFQVFVIDDNSNDGTSLISKDFSAIVIKNKENIGYEKSLDVGLKEAYKTGYKFAVTMDADDQHDFEDVIKFSESLGRYDLVLGRRPYFPRFSERVFHKLSKWKFNIYDPLCGLKGYNLNEAKKVNFFSKRDTMGFSLARKMRQKGLKTLELNISIKKRVDKSRLGNLISSELKILKALLNSLFHSN